MQIFKTRSRTFIYLGFGVLALTLLAFWLDYSTESAREKTAVINESTDYEMQQFTLVSLDESGQPFQWLSGKDMLHFPDNRVTLTEPKFVLEQESKKQWQVSAKEGKIDTENNIELAGNVKIEQIAGAEKMTVSTTRLVILDNRQIAESSNLVTVVTSNGQISAKGMRANLSTQQLHLLSEVKGYYVQ